LSHLLLQFTDMHLYADPQSQLMGISTAESFQAVLKLAKNHFPNPELLLITGDISQDETSQSYILLDKLLKKFFADQPGLLLAGNHDIPQVLGKVFPDKYADHHSYALASWRIMSLNSAVPGQVAGALSEDSLKWLSTELMNCQEDNILVTLHHNPVPIRAHWLQLHALQNPEALLEVLRLSPRIRAVVFGHIHQELDEVHYGIRFLGSPSTCVQFHPLHKEFAVDTQQPGYRWMVLESSGKLKTGVERLPAGSYQAHIE
jgi:Icc protein